MHHAAAASISTLLPAPLSSERRGQGGAACPRKPGAALLTGYEAAIGAILQSVERSTAGDAVLLRSYVIEDGRSSRAVLAALSRAADRGVRVTLGLDRTLLSSFTRAVEGTTSLLPEVLALAHRKANISLEAAGERPDHSKVFLRHSDNHDECEGVMGGVNLGDRFAQWRDFCLHVTGPSVQALERLVSPGASSGTGTADGVGIWPSASQPTDDGIRFAANQPSKFCPLRFAARLPLLSSPEAGCTNALHAFFQSPVAHTFLVATAYIDMMGARLLLQTLRRGKDVLLIVPSVPNVYTHSNRSALAWLIWAARKEGGALRVVMHPAMMHAKAAVAFTDGGDVEGILGSCNLKTRSLTQFGELLAHVTGQAARQLRDALGVLAEESEEVTLGRQLWHDPFISVAEAYLG